MDGLEVPPLGMLLNSLRQAAVGAPGAQAALIADAGAVLGLLRIRAALASAGRLASQGRQAVRL